MFRGKKKTIRVSTNVMLIIPTKDSTRKLRTLNFKNLDIRIPLPKLMIMSRKMVFRIISIKKIAYKNKQSFRVKIYI